MGYFGIFPNLLISPHPDYVLTHRIEPLAPDRSFVECEWLFPPEALELDGFDPAYAVDFWDVTNREDWAACESLQRAAASRGHGPGPMSTVWKAASSCRWADRRRLSARRSARPSPSNRRRRPSPDGISSPEPRYAVIRLPQLRTEDTLRRMSDSVSFDRAAAYYDETRGLSEEGVRRTTAVLSGLFSSAGRVLEVGVGTGQVSLPLHEAGVDLVGIDLAQPMLDALLEKAGGSSPFPLVRGDATRMPFRDRTFGGAFLRWVLHLIPDWRGAVREIARVLAPGAVFAASLGTYGGQAHRRSRRGSPR